MKSRTLIALSLITLFSLPSLGAEGVKGTKRFRSALNGALYIGGGDQLKQRDNRNPLLNETLDRLCDAGFTESIFLYTKTSDRMRRDTRCSSGNLRYDAISWTKIDTIMKRIHNNIMTKEGPMYVHCYNGAHAANGVGAMAKIQFCGMSNSDALKQWLEQTDDHGRKEYAKGGFNSVTKRIKRYKVNSSLSLPSSLKSQICN
jgi:hypothetical protein